MNVYTSESIKLFWRNSAKCCLTLEKFLLLKAGSRRCVHIFTVTYVNARILPKLGPANKALNKRMSQNRENCDERSEMRFVYYVWS